MATEYIQEPFYYYKDNAHKFIDIHRSIQIAVEDFLVTTLLKGDFSRAVYCSQDICFRRRVELVDAEHKDMESIMPINLELPFVSYSQSSDFDVDDRPAVMQAAEAMIGEYIEEFGYRLRNIPVKSTYKATVFFARRDEIRMAHQILLWDKFPKAPIWVYSNVIWKGKKLAIPCFITIDSVSSKTEYQESDWLTKNRIFPLDISMTVRSYQVLIPNINNIIDLPVRWGNTYSPATNSEDDTIYITQEAILVFANKKFQFEDTKEKIDIEKQEVVENAPRFFSDKHYTREQLEEMCGKLPNYETNDILEGYWTETHEVALNRLGIKSKTDHSCVISYMIKPSDKKHFKSITFYIPAHPEVTITDPNVTEVEIDGLYARSKYEIKVILMGKQGTRNLVSLSCTTLDSPENLAPNPNGETFKEGNIIVDAGKGISNSDGDNIGATPMESRADKVIIEGQDATPKNEGSKAGDNVTVRRGNSLLGIKF